MVDRMFASNRSAGPRPARIAGFQPARAAGFQPASPLVAPASGEKKQPAGIRRCGG